MACNCSKKAQPTGFGRSPRDQQLAQREGARQDKARLTTPDGKTATFGSHLEASAARVRRGGGTISPL